MYIRNTVIVLVEIEVVVEVYTHSVSSKYTLDPIHRMMKSTGTPVERQKVSQVNGAFVH